MSDCLAYLLRTHGRSLRLLPPWCYTRSPNLEFRISKQSINAQKIGIRNSFPVWMISCLDDSNLFRISRFDIRISRVDFNGWMLFSESVGAKHKLR